MYEQEGKRSEKENPALIQLLLLRILKSQIVAPCAC